MGWLQKRPQVALPINYYTTGQNNIVLLVGLGNPSKKYDLTRHNIGFSVLDYIVDRFDELGSWTEKKDLKCQLSQGRFGENQVICIKPLTYMNLSGEAVALSVNYYKVQLEHLVVIHDDLDIDFGSIRTRVDGSDAGHNGIKSIDSHIGTNYGRVRIGIGPKEPPDIDSADYVLEHFSDEQNKQMGNLKRECAAILTEFIYSKNLPNETRHFIV